MHTGVLTHLLTGLEVEVKLEVEVAATDVAVITNQKNRTSIVIVDSNKLTVITNTQIAIIIKSTD